MRTSNGIFASALLAFSMLCTGVIHAQATDGRVKAALRLIDLGNAREAISTLQQLVQQEPKNAEAHAGLALADVEINNVGAALTEAQEAFDLDRRNVLVRIARGTVYGKQGHVQDALKDFQDALKSNDKEIGTYLALSHYYISIDSLKPAEILLYRAQQTNDKDVRSYLGLAELYERQHIPDLAIGQYEQALQRDPNDVIVHAKLAGLYFRTRKYNESAGEWLKIIRIDSTYGDAYYQIANLYFLAHQYANAAMYATKYAALRPNDIAGQWLLARAMTENGQYKEALPALQAVSSNDSLRALSQLLLARSYFFSKDYPKALDIYRNAKTLGPLDLSNYAAILITQGDTAGGIDQYKKSLVDDTIRSAQEKLQTQIAIINLLYKQKRYEEAGQMFAEMAQATPSVHWYLSAGQAYSSAKKPELAKQYYDKALALEPNSVAVRYQIAFDALTSDAGTQEALDAFDKLEATAKAAGSTDTVALAEGFMAYHFGAHKDWAKAATHLEDAVKPLEGGKSPFLMNFELLLAQSYHQQHEIEKAKVWYEKVLKLDPDNKGAKEGLEFIRQAPSEEKSGKKKK
ncbi:MAG: tetratricopeptide repeat protein [Bacteroidota bacterium]|nr:tetratricopeptide repeat protein [Bacteroidota bacterium]MDP4233286.1 tetratricopeptide repeat protein [Bacteroidota bacterium]MDP4242094.1 tetratricopeptide repeat protein [Bacteroidota bacterium]MDP4288627.1 tetratricopeptide repeat protein [Bacteroidota bacterium]